MPGGPFQTAMAFHCQAGCDCYFCETQRRLGKQQAAGPSLDVVVAEAAARHAKYLGDTLGEAGRDYARRFHTTVGSKVGAVVGYVEHSPRVVRLLCVLVALCAVCINLQQLVEVRLYRKAILERGGDFVGGKYPRTLKKYVQSQSPVAALYNLYQAFFALVTVLIEADLRCVQRVVRLQELLHQQALFLTTRRGRAFFYLFQATLSLFQFKAADLACGSGMVLCAVLLLCCGRSKTEVGAAGPPRLQAQRS